MSNETIIARAHSIKNVEGLIYCPYCGFKIPESIIICWKCGKRLRASSNNS